MSLIRKAFNVRQTAFTEDTMRQRAWAADFDAFVLKPATLGAILVALVGAAIP
jgi:hypothetical protein